MTGVQTCALPISFYPNDDGDAGNNRLSSADMYASVPTGEYPAGSPNERGESSFGHADYDRYAEHNMSGQASTMNLSIDDGDSQRNLYGSPRSQHMHTASNLQYGDGPDDTEVINASSSDKAKQRGRTDQASRKAGRTGTGSECAALALANPALGRLRTLPARLADQSALPDCRSPGLLGRPLHAREAVRTHRARRDPPRDRHRRRCPRRPHPEQKLEQQGRRS